MLCFLHSVLKLGKPDKKDTHRQVLVDKVWDAYRAESLASFSQQIRRLGEWAEKVPLLEKVRNKTLELCQKAPDFKVSYGIPGAHRTSAMLDRLMDYQDRMLYRARYLHSDDLQGTGRLYVRAMGLMWNFHPFGRKTGRHSPFADVNQFFYHKNWLQNLLIASSLGGCR